MRVGLFIPCYIDQFYPEVGMATVEVLQRQGVEVVYPPEQTCCGQPMANTGCNHDAQVVAEHFLRTFQQFDYVVAPSGSCVAMVRCHYADLLPDTADAAVCQRTFELCEFLTDVVGVRQIAGQFPYRVGLHQGCHGLRELGLAGCSEHMTPRPDKPRQLLQSLTGIKLVPLSRADECCGFGGLFAVAEEAVSCRMGLDRLADHQQAGAQVLTSADMSCLMHLGGLASRQRLPLAVMHIAEILAGREPRFTSLAKPEGIA